MIDNSIPEEEPPTERRDEKTDRRNRDRRAHDRYTPADGVRIDRRQTERRSEPG